MQNGEFPDYYEVMEVSPNANSETIERVFRYLGQRLHPDNADTGDDGRFRGLLEAYGTLRDPRKRAAYDAQYRAYQERRCRLVRGSADHGDDNLDRHRLLSLFYAQRRREMRRPGVGISALEQSLGCPGEVLDFHLWYFREKGWIKREETGLFAITAEGIDKIESSEQKITRKDRAITMRTENALSDTDERSEQISSQSTAPHMASRSLKRRTVSGFQNE